ncbi:U3 small nucleolar RNA-associated protein [Recurvomyces mirabilis]|uniref:U3 small nucleolar RNA-associated protein n=1 Tax=Recurvomyces mirabilis TaxID=574656 RepID=A0AAE0WNR6_9PEZI|nr:U3 small nucleolar RNA-associated protein [Recurvomyces mirabilis]KAK5157885.1 U3 small nucleolar RNA-associated protein [Recurvomyces mirabilis]
MSARFRRNPAIRCGLEILEVELEILALVQGKESEEQAAIMDVHRSRFVPYPTSAISALAFSRQSDAGYTGPLPALKLAIGRANGEIEVWNPLQGQWAQETQFVGDGSGVDGLAWTQDPDETDGEGPVLPGQQRLFSIASSPAVVEWDLATGEPKRKSTGNFSEVWCFGAQPRWRSTKSVDDEARSQDIVAGCGDGTLVVLTTADNDLQFKRFLARVAGKRARCMCITYQNRDIVVAGFADSAIRVYDTRNGSQIRQMSLGSGIPGAPKTAIVWQLKVMQGGDIVSGDSNGEVRMWDGKNYSLTQRLVGHESDCLDLATSADGKSIFSGSLDGRIAVYRQATDANGRRSWAKHGHRRVHTREVKAMTSFDSKNGLSVVVSGGTDVAPVLTPLREYGRENLRAMPSLPQEPRVVAAPRARLIASWWDKEVHIWRIASRSAASAETPTQSPRKLVAKLALDVKQNIRCATLSSDGRLLIAATSQELKVFQLRNRLDSDSLAIRKLALPSSFAQLGARQIGFSPDGKWLAVVTADSEVHIARFTSDSAQPKRLICLPQTVELDRRSRKVVSSAYKAYDRTITRLAFAADSSVLVTGDVSGHLDSWVLEGHEDPTAPAVDNAKHDSDNKSSANDSDSDSDSSDSDDDDDIAVFYGQHWTNNPSGHLLPKLESAPLVLTFRPVHSQPTMNGNPGVHSTRHNPHAHSHQLPTGPHLLWIMTARHNIYEFNTLSGRLSDWSKRNPTAALPDEFRQIKDRVVGAVWDANEKRGRLWLYGTSWVFMLNLGRDLAEPAKHDMQSSKKRRRKSDGRANEGERRLRRKSNSGAGDRVGGRQSLGALESFLRVENGRRDEIDLRAVIADEEEEDGDMDDDDGGVQLAGLMGQGSQEDGGHIQDGDSTGQDRKFWCTFSYRPILGMVPLEDATLPADAERALEVAIVERPL